MSILLVFFIRTVNWRIVKEHFFEMLVKNIFFVFLCKTLIIIQDGNIYTNGREENVS